MKVLLINPRGPETIWSNKWLLDEIRVEKRAINPPLGIATVAALCPPDWEVEIVDENVEVVPLETDADIVGVGGMAAQFDRQMELVDWYRRQGCHTVVGGPQASLEPEAYEGRVDTVISGEAENVFRRFCSDFIEGRPAALYREDGNVDLADSPTPRFDLLKLHRYHTASIQFSRGCPHRCEFCDIIVMYGRKPRTKSPEQIGRELDALRAEKARNVFFVDDNFIGHRKASGELLAFLADYQRRHGPPMMFSTEVTVDVATREDQLEALQRAGFRWVFVGIESTDASNLADVGKVQNLGIDPLDAVSRIHAAGIDVYGAFILGFDHDTTDTFEQQRRFIEAAGISLAQISVLTAVPKTPLHARLEKEGRLRDDEGELLNIRLSTNVLPKGMSYEELLEGYRWIYGELYSDESIARKIRNKRAQIREGQARAEGADSERETKTGYRSSALLRPIYRLITRGVFPGGWRRIAAVASSLWGIDPRRPGELLQALRDWSMALSIQSYVERHFVVESPRAQWALEALRRGLEGGPVRIATEERASGQRVIRLRIGDRESLGLVYGKRSLLLRLLRDSPYELVLDLSGWRAPEASLGVLLETVAPWSTRVDVAVDRALLEREELALWRFGYALPTWEVSLRSEDAPASACA